MAKNLIHFRCKHCTSPMTAKRRKAGQVTRCPACFREITIPAESLKTPGEDELYGVTPEGGKPIDYITVVCHICQTRISEPAEKLYEYVACPDCESLVQIVRMPSDPAADSAKPSQSNTKPGAKPGVIYGVQPGSGSKSKTRPQPKADQSHVPQPQSEPAQPEQPKLIPVYCKLCHTLMYGELDQVGRKLQCPDCSTETVVPEPTPEIKIEHKTVEFEGSTTYGVIGERSESQKLPPQDVPDPMQAQIPVKCQLCNTLMYAMSAQVGAELKCPDCGCMTVVPDIEPIVPNASDLIAPSTSSSDLYGVGRAIKTPEVDDMNRFLPRTERYDDEGRLRDLESLRPKLPDFPLIQGVFTLFRSPGIHYILAMYMLMGLVAGLLSLNAMASGVLGLGFLQLIAAAMLGLLTLLSFGFHCSYILQASADGIDRIDEWPDAEFLDWWIESIRMPLSAIAASSMPGWVLGGFQYSPESIQYAAISTFLLYPVIMLSMATNGTPLEPISFQVLKGLFLRPLSWLGIYIESALLFGVLTAMTLIFWQISWILVGLSVPVWLLGILVYFRLIGRLGWACNETLRERAITKAEDEDEIEEK